MNPQILKMMGFGMGGSQKEMWDGKTKDFTFHDIESGFVDWFNLSVKGCLLIDLKYP